MLSLEQEYRNLLQSNGITEDYFNISPEMLEAFDNIRKKQDRRDGVNSLPAPDTLGNAPNVNDVFRYQSGEIVKAIRSIPSVVQCETDTLTGIFPTGSINAQARSCEAGALILLNDGLTAFFQQFSGILLHYTGLQDRMFQDHVVQHFSQRLDTDAVVEALADLLAGYMRKGTDRSLSMKYGFPGGAQGLYFTILNAEFVYFILAHEHMHASLGHLAKDRTMMPVTTPVGDIEFVRKSWEEEVDADVGGLYAQLALSSSQQELFGRLPFMVGAIYMFFSIDDLLTVINHEVANRLGLNLPVITDHPPAELRIKAIEQWLLQRKANDDVFSHARVFTESLNEIRDAIVSLVFERLQLGEGV